MGKEDRDVTTLLEIFGPVAIPTLICLAAGLLLLLIEMFTPGFGVPGLLGLLLLAAVIALGAGIVVLNIVSPGVGLRF